MYLSNGGFTHLSGNLGSIIIPRLPDTIFNQPGGGGVTPSAPVDTPAPGPTVLPGLTIPAQWYKTWWGIGGIGLAAFAGYHYWKKRK